MRYFLILMAVIFVAGSSVARSVFVGPYECPASDDAGSSADAGSSLAEASCR